MTFFRKSLGLMLAVALVLGSSVAEARLGGGSVAVLMFRILAFDRALAERSPDKTTTLLVLYKAGQSASEGRHKEVFGALQAQAAKANIAGLSVRVVSAAYADPAQLEQELARQRATALFLCPGLEEQLSGIAEVAKKKKALTFIDDDSSLGPAAVAMVPRDGKAAVVVNLGASRAQGADLDSAFLKLVDVRR